MGKIFGPLAQLAWPACFGGQRARPLSKCISRMAFLRKLDGNHLIQGLEDMLLELGNFLGRGGGKRSSLIRRDGPGDLPLNLPPLKNPLHNALGSPQVFGIGLCLPQPVQHQLQIHLEHRLGRGRRRALFFLLQQIQGHIRPLPLLLSRPGHQLLCKGLGQGAKGGQRQPLL